MPTGASAVAISGEECVPKVSCLTPKSKRYGSKFATGFLEFRDDEEFAGRC